MTLGLYTFNPATQQFLPSGHQEIPSGIAAGAGYYFDNTVLICFEIEKMNREKAAYYGGFEIILVKMLMVRFGISSGIFQRFHWAWAIKDNICRLIWP
jgi:hypothetical protein